MKIRPLPSADRLRELLDYNPETGAFTWRVRVAQRCPVGTVAGTPIKDGRRLISVDKRLYYAHRLAWRHMTGEDPPEMIDHANGDPTDNRWANLRKATRAQNMRNSKRPTTNATGYKGVYWDRKHPQQFGACIRVDGKTKRLGYFATPEEAHAAYCEAALTHYGDFSRFD